MFCGARLTVLYARALFEMVSFDSFPVSRSLPYTVQSSDSASKLMYEVSRSPGATRIAGAVTAPPCTNHDCNSQCDPLWPYCSTGCSTGYPITGSSALKPGQKYTTWPDAFDGSAGTTQSAVKFDQYDGFCAAVYIA
jgi:hypothetical protein